MGGHAVGEKASAKAIRDIPLTYIKHAVTDGPRAAIRRAFVEANAGIYQIGLINPEFKGLGTTGSALFLRADGAWVGHVGDSRVYRVRGDRIEQLTFDHSWVWEMARRQGIDPDELGDVRRNVIIRSLGPEAEVEVDVEGPHAIEPGDTFIICSDGLTNHVKPDEIGLIMAIMPPKEACSFLVELANLRGGSDNVTALIAQVESGEGTGAKPRSRGPGTLAKLANRWGRKVSWPLTGIVFGGALVGLSIALRLERMPGAALIFLFAAIVMLISLAALAVQLRRKVEEGSSVDDEPPVIRIYKEYIFRLDRTQYEHLTAEEESARKKAEEAGLPIDWSAHAALIRQSEAAAGTDWRTAIIARCQALELAAGPFNRLQHKDEAFRPNWTSQTRAL